MADAVATQTLRDDGRLVVMKFTNISDGTGESAVTKVDVSALAVNPITKQACTGVSIQRIQYDVRGMDVKILWGADTDVLCYNVTEGNFGDQDFSDFGGLTNNAGAGKTGDIKFTTVNHTLSDVYTIILSMHKYYG